VSQLAVILRVTWWNSNLGKKRDYKRETLMDKEAWRTLSAAVTLRSFGNRDLSASIFRRSSLVPLFCGSLVGFNGIARWCWRSPRRFGFSP
jgi:hypothetical protein